MSRKGENIRKRKDGRWEARYIKERGTGSTATKYGYVYAYSYNEVRKKRQELITRLDSESTMDPPASDLTFNQIYLLWLGSVQNELKPSTLSCYKNLAQKHLVPHFGELEISQMTDKLVQGFVRQKKDVLTASTMRLLSVIFNHIIRYASANYESSCSNLTISYAKNHSKQKFLMKNADYSKLETYLLNKDSTSAFGLLLGMQMGLRIGEVCGLLWSDIDLDTGILSVNRTVSRISLLENNVKKTLLYIGTPKSKSGIRQIPMTQFQIEMTKIKMGNPDHFILTDNAQCSEPRSIQRKFKRILKKLDIPDTNFHTLRHQFATRWIEYGFDYKSLSEVLGHASASTTMNIYVHSNAEQKQKYMEQLHSI